ncbi:2-ketogluconate 6-phosphate reductase [Klebsiella michiganensis]|uniref:2-ketogluconate 6-phosphate reductase n=1 Tax=Klebsiella michiganensis TaxID=1134687 RepID=A0A7H4PFP5_9ENTR|nr:2-ketogluconate 6-phosphate reductase [Klebsiella michiganensis]
MKPSVILYKTLPDDLQQRLEQHFTVTQVKNLRPETVSQHADAFAEAVGLLGSSEKSRYRVTGENAQASCDLDHLRRL